MKSDNLAYSNYTKYESFGIIECTSGKVVIVRSTSLLDPAWDDFLNSIPGAEFDQSSLWAAARESDGWDFIRFVFLLNNQIVGGYQLFTKNKRYIGKFGYTIKGPVYSIEYSHLAPIIVEHLLKEVKGQI